VTIAAPTRGDVAGAVGSSAVRPDGIPKLTGNFAYSSDISAPGMLWGATLRSPHAHARITGLDIAAAVASPGVSAVLTLDDVPGAKRYGLEIADQPVLAEPVVRFWGEPVAIVAADDIEDARRAVAAIEVDYQPLEPLVDAEEAVTRGEVFRSIAVRRGDRSAGGSVVVEGSYDVGM
jgi:CO/xanthine dehydrogenase Mo-binding subunit